MSNTVLGKRGAAQRRCAASSAKNGDDEMNVDTMCVCESCGIQSDEDSVNMDGVFYAMWSGTGEEFALCPACAAVHGDAIRKALMEIINGECS